MRVVALYLTHLTSLTAWRMYVSVNVATIGSDNG